MRFLLDLVDPDLRLRIRERIGLAPHEVAQSGAMPSEQEQVAARRIVADPRTPLSVIGWMHAADDPEVNALLYRGDRTPEGVRIDVMLGIPSDVDRRPGGIVRMFRSLGATRVKRTAFELGTHYYTPTTDSDERGLVATLRERGAALELKGCREVAGTVGRQDWARIGVADREQELPGYARWALCVQPGCPAWLRRQLGGEDPHFAKRMRKEGIALDSADYVAHWTPVQHVLDVLDLGRWAFPEALRPAAESSRPLVENELGGQLEAWAVLGQLAPSFTGTLPELIRTSAAIAGGSR